MLYGKLLAPLIETFELRKKAVTNFLSDISFPQSHLKIVGLNDPFGPPATNPNFQCIVASPESTAVGGLPFLYKKWSLYESVFQV